MSIQYTADPETTWAAAHRFTPWNEPYANMNQFRLYQIAREAAIRGDMDESADAMVAGWATIGTPRACRLTAYSAFDLIFRARVQMELQDSPIAEWSKANGVGLTFYLIRETERFFEKANRGNPRTIVACINVAEELAEDFAAKILNDPNARAEIERLEADSSTD